MNDSKTRPAWIIQQTLDVSRFRCCGNEDLRPFRCVHCNHPMVLCCECDTVYHTLPDTTVKSVADWSGWNCPKCASVLTGEDFVGSDANVSFDEWSSQGLDDFIRTRPITELFAIVVRSSKIVADDLRRNRQTSAKTRAREIDRIADAIAHCKPEAQDARRSARHSAASGSRSTALAACDSIADPVRRAYAILGICDTLPQKSVNR